MKRILNPLKNNKTANGITIYDCINKTKNLECKGSKKGTGYVLTKGTKCFDCQFAGKPWLRKNVNPSASSSPSLSPKNSSPRRNSICVSPTYTPANFLAEESPENNQSPAESLIDPHMFNTSTTNSTSLKRHGAISRTKRRAKSAERLSITADLREMASQVVGIGNNHDSTSLTNYLEQEEKNNNPRLPSTREWNSKTENTFIGIFNQVAQFTFNLKRENEEELRKRIEELLVINQKLLDENEILRQKVKKFQEYKFYSEADRFQRLSLRQRNKNQGLDLEDSQENRKWCRKIAKLQATSQPHSEPELVAQIEVPTYLKSGVIKIKVE